VADFQEVGAEVEEGVLGEVSSISYFKPFQFYSNTA
jgi:hypothetical protein